MSPRPVDALIVGAGPAGAGTALLLARAGHEVVLVDRATFPRAKPCGDCLSPEAGRVLDRLGVLGAVHARRPARLEGWRIVAPDGASFQGRFEPAADGDVRARTAIALPRAVLDHVLVEAARRAGARLIEGIRIEDVLRDASGSVSGVRGRGQRRAAAELRARLVVGADGLRSVIARRLGLVRRRPRLRKLSLTGHVQGVTGLGLLGEMHLGDGICAGLAPVEQKAAYGNLTIVVDADRFREQVGKDPAAFFWRTGRRFPRLAGRLQHASFAAASHRTGPGTAGSDTHGPDALESSRPLLTCGPFDWPTRDIVTDGAALVGDAAGYYDPFTGQGIYRALAGAELLAAEADAALGRDDVSARSLRGYARRHARRFRQGRLLQRLVEAVTARPRVATAAITRLGHGTAAADALIAATGDLRAPHTLLSPALLLTLLVRPSTPELPWSR